jgi:hypothetical protein
MAYDRAVREYQEAANLFLRFDKDAASADECMREAQKVSSRAKALRGHRHNPLSEDGMVVSNPAKRRGGGRAQKAGLAKGQSLMAQAAAAYRAGKYASMQDALKGVARGGARRKNPLSEDGVVVRNPAKRGKGKAKRSGGRTAAQSNAAKAMKLFHSGKASSLAEAWDMIRSGR